MTLTVFDGAGAFLDAVQAALEEQEVANSLMLGLALGIKRHARPDLAEHAPYFAAVSEGGTLAVAALRTPPHHVLVQAVNADPAAALAPVVDDLAERCPDLPGVRGPDAVSTAFAEAWTARTGAPHRPGPRTRAFELRAVTPPPETPGGLRQATPQDEALLADWFGRFHREALRDESHADFGQIARRRLAAGEVYLWQAGGAPVTMVARSRPTRNGVTVNAVYTPPERRRRGYATAATAALSQLLLYEGFSFCTLFTDLANPTSNKIYQQIGYRPVCDFQEYGFAPAPGR